MEAQNGNNKEAKSKIEQIRIDLEKKLAAIEDSKKEIVDVDNQEELKNKVEDLSANIAEKENKIIEKLDEVEAKPVFEISEPIIPVEAMDVIDTDKKEVVNETKPKEIITEINKTESQESKKIITPPKTIIAAVEKKPEVKNISTTNVDEQDKVEQDEENKSKKGIFSFLIYALLVGFFVVIGYFYIDYNRESKSVEQEKMNQKLSEFKNKRYLDSIELADLNSQLEDLQSKKMLDSLDRVYEQELIANSKFKNKKEIQRNFDLTSLKNEKLTASNSKLSNTTSEQEKKKTVENKTSPLLETKGDNDDIVASTNSRKGDVVSSQKTKEDDVSSQTAKEEDVSSQTVKEDELNLVAKSNEKIKEEGIKSDTKKSNNISIKKHIVKSPIYPGCEKKKTDLDRKKCFTSKMYKHISRKFNTSLAQNMGLEEGIHQVRVQYIIDKAGYATVLNVRAENKKLEQEAIRVIQSLPKMTPGTIDGKRTKLPYNIPIKFAVNN